MLKTSETNQNVFVTVVSIEAGAVALICKVVAVTLDKNVAMVVRFTCC